MAVYTDVFIARLALGHIGIGQTIEDLDANGSLEETCKEFFDHAREEVLEAFEWPITTKQITPALVAADPNGDWGFSHRYPVGCLAIRRVVDPAGLPQSEPIPFALGQDDTGRLIFSDQEELIVEVSYWYADPGEWPSYLAKAISWNLATYICGPLGKGGQRDACVAGYLNAKGNAAGLAAREQQKKPRPPSSYTSCR